MDEFGNTGEKLQHHLCVRSASRMQPAREDKALEPARRILEKCAGKEELIVAGDLNCHVGREGSSYER